LGGWGRSSVLALLALVFAAAMAGCEDDNLSGFREKPDGGPDLSLRLDAGSYVVRVAELRSPSHAVTSTLSGGERVRLRLPSAAHNVSSSPEHNLRTTVGAAVAGGSR
jgi:hypothetical protein